MLMTPPGENTWTKTASSPNIPDRRCGGTATSTSTAAGNTPSPTVMESPRRWDGTILVPSFSPESALSGVGRSLQPGQTLWYRREVILPQGFIPADGRLLLHFGAVDQEAAVYWNGRLLGRHMGGYNAFTLDATDALGPRNSLVVRVHDDTDASFHSRGKQKTPARRDLVYAAKRHLADGVDGGRAPALYRACASCRCLTSRRWR